MKIMISYFFAVDALPIGQTIAQACRDNDYDVCTFHCQQESHWNNYFFKRIQKILKIFGVKTDYSVVFHKDNLTFRGQKLIAALASEKPDILLIMRGLDFPEEVLTTAKQNGWVKHVVGWWVGHPASTDKLQDKMKGVDQYYSIHPETNVSSVKYLNLSGYDPIHYFKLDNVDRNIDISFVGGVHPDRRKMLSALTDTNLHIYGPGWRKLKHGWTPDLWRCVKGRGIYGEALNTLYNRSKIVLNVTLWPTTVENGTTLRIFDVPATGSLLLTDYHEGLKEFFVLGQEIETWSTIEELHDKAKYYLKHDDIREKIALAGYQKVQTLENYPSKMHRLLSEIEKTMNQ